VTKLFHTSPILSSLMVPELYLSLLSKHPASPAWAALSKASGILRFCRANHICVCICICSYKPQKISPKFEGSVRALLHKKIRESYLHPQFQSDVMKPLNIEALMDQDVQNLSGEGSNGLELRKRHRTLSSGDLFLLQHGNFVPSFIYFQGFSVWCHCVKMHYSSNVKCVSGCNESI
jgi:hypothetical protein